MPTRNLLIITLTAAISMACYAKAQRNRYATGITEAMQLIESRYVDEVESRQLFENAMKGLVGGLDQYSAYISPEDFQQFQESIDQEFGGIGIHVEVDPKTERLTILSPLLGTPAFNAGVKPGDTIMQIYGEDTAGMSLRDAVEVMRGPEGEIVHLVIRRVGEDVDREFEISRAKIPLESVHGDYRSDDGTWEFLLEQDPRITYIRLTTFGEASVKELRKALIGVDGDKTPPQALILDLRDNAGGLLRAAVETCDMFIEKGTIVSIRGRSKHDIYKATSEVLFDNSIPMVVLVNHDSASASEIVAACLQDHNRAIIVGDRTWGKGTVQNIIELDNGTYGPSALKLTTASYWRPSNKNIHRHKGDGDDKAWGVSPNPGFELKLADELREQIALQRRDREIYFGDNQPPPKLADDAGDIPQPPESEGEPPAPEVDTEDGDPVDGSDPVDGETSIDSQLQMAVEYLQKQLAK